MRGPLSVVLGVLLGMVAALFCGCTKLWNNKYKRTAVVIASGESPGRTPFLHAVDAIESIECGAAAAQLSCMVGVAGSMSLVCRPAGAQGHATAAQSSAHWPVLNACVPHLSVNRPMPRTS